MPPIVRRSRRHLSRLAQRCPRLGSTGPLRCRSPLPQTKRCRRGLASKGLTPALSGRPARSPARGRRKIHSAPAARRRERLYGPLERIVRRHGSLSLRASNFFLSTYLSSPAITALTLGSETNWQLATRPTTSK